MLIPNVIEFRRKTIHLRRDIFLFCLTMSSVERIRRLLFDIFINLIVTFIGVDIPRLEFTDIVP